jgi:citrate synthase
MLTFDLLSVTLNLKVGMQVLLMTNCLIIVTFVAKYLQNTLIYEKVMGTGHKIYSLKDYVNLWPPSVTLTLEVGDLLSAWHIVSLLWTIVASIYKIPSKIESYEQDTTYTIK